MCCMNRFISCAMILQKREKKEKEKERDEERGGLVGSLLFCLLFVSALFFVTS